MKKLITAALAVSLLVSGAATTASAANWNSHNNNNNHSSYGHQQVKHHGWKNGGYLPAQYRHNKEVDWRSHHLRQPPRGSHWVQTDGDYVLVALTTGLIMQAIANAN
jgi:Ni/Co efflux regulator RcnB